MAEHFEKKKLVSKNSQIGYINVYSVDNYTMHFIFQNLRYYFQQTFLLMVKPGEYD